LNFLFHYIVSSIVMLYEPFTRSSTPSSFTFSSKPPTREPSPVFSESNRISSLPSPPSRSPTPEECGTPPERHADYYLDDELVIFRVEIKVYRIHRYFLTRESDFFRTMFDLPCGDIGVEGRTDRTAIPLPDVTCAELESLLNFIYNGMHDDPKLTLPEWINVLSISTRFICDRIRERSIREIHQHRPRINPVEKIVLATKFDVQEWLAPSYEDICQREHPLEVYEAEKLGLVVSILLARAREAVRQEACFRDSSAVSQTPPLHSPVAFEGSSWPGLTVSDLWQPYSSQRVSEIVQEVFWPPAPTSD